ncbi:MAG: Flp pilus assembly protein CpaB, partial [Candidatus Limnocylindrales bacterium]
MEMEFKDDTRRRKVLLVLGLMFAVAAAGGAFYLINQAQSAGTGKVPTREVVVAAHDISARSVIAADDVVLRALPDDPSITSALTSPDDAIGRIAGVTIFAQQALTPNLLTSSEAGSGYSVLSPEETVAPDSPYWRAFSINVSDDRAVAGTLLAGQHVDVIVSVTYDVQALGGNAGPTPTFVPNGTYGPVGPYYGDTSTKLTYQDVPILAHNLTLYILKLTVAQAEEITHFMNIGAETNFT